MRKKILFPFVGTSIGGSYVSAATMAKQIRDYSEWKIEVTLPKGAENRFLFEEYSIPINQYNLSKDQIQRIKQGKGIIGKVNALASYKEAYKSAKWQLKNMSPSLVHINDDATIIPWGLAAKKLEIPVIWHVRQNQGNKWLDKIRMNIADFIIFTSNHTSDRFKEIGLKKPSKIIFDEIDFGKFHQVENNKPDYKERLGLNKDKVVIGFVGNFTSNKRPDWFMKACCELIKQGRPIQAVIIGKDYSNGYYPDLFNQYKSGLEDKESIKFIGFTEKPQKWMRAMDILCLTSISESFGRVLVEAMASGASVISTNSGGVNDIIQPNKTGIITDSSNYNDFKQCLDELIQDPNKRELMSVNGMMDVHNRFSSEAAFSELASVYTRFL